MFRDLVGMSWKDFFICLALLGIVGGLVSWGCSELTKPKKPLHEKLTDAECRARLDCWSAKHRARFMPRCILAVERHSPHGHVWHVEEAFGRSFVRYFPHVVWRDAKTGRFIWIGFGASQMDASGRLHPIEYECAVDPVSGRVKAEVERAN